jgi:hypothetical protein
MSFNRGLTAFRAMKFAFHLMLDSHKPMLHRLGARNYGHAPARRFPVKSPVFPHIACASNHHQYAPTVHPGASQSPLWRALKSHKLKQIE